jgi:threonine dehydrogenase-like Zn-dependent dehydrogenase
LIVGQNIGREFHHAGDLAGQVALEQLAHAARRLGVVEQVGLAVGQALVDMAAATGQGLVRLGHEAGHDAEALADLAWRSGLEQDGAVGLLQRAR